MQVRKKYPLLSLAALLGGCAVGPTYHAPQASQPSAFGEAGGNPTAAEKGATAGLPPDPNSLTRWWTVFHDAELDSLLERALRNNRDLRVAISRVREARAQRQVASSALIPEVDATAGYNRSRGSKNVVLPLSSLTGNGSTASADGSANPQETDPHALSPMDAATSPASASGAGAQSTGSAPPGGPNSPFGEGGLPGVTTNLFQAGFDAVWEIDVFGGTRRAIEAADAQAEAAQEGAYGVRVTLMAEVATTYLQLRSNQEREEIARNNIESQRLTWRIAQDKFEQGVGDEVGAAQELAQLRAAEATIPPLLAAERVDQHALSFLLGEDPTGLSSELSPHKGLPSLPGEVPVGVPSDLLRRRPDIRQAERQLAVSSAVVGESTAELYPQFSLTGSFGLDSSDLKHLPEWSSHYYSIAPGVSWPILDWAKLRAAIRAANEEETQALLAYQTAIEQALKDVEDALVKYEQERGRNAALQRASEQAAHARQVTEQIYEQGLADETATLEAERAVLQADDQLAQSDANLRIELVSLYKALGGGWEVKG
jgi:NodT family efflux transporter outer membrane factor (OMF) lipoprotein